MIRVAVLGLILVISSVSQAFYCSGSDREVSRYLNWDRQACTTSGNCYAYDYNPATGNYEYYWGFHSNCPGTQQRTVYEITCERPDGSRYQGRDEGSWGFCSVN